MEGYFGVYAAGYVGLGGEAGGAGCGGVGRGGGAAEAAEDLEGCRHFLRLSYFVRFLRLEDGGEQ